MTVEWRGKPVWILKRTPEQLAELTKHDAAAGRPAVRSAIPTSSRPRTRATSTARSSPKSWSSSASARTSAARPRDKFQPGPQPSLPDDWEGGFLCPCHGSTFDLAGRVFKNKPAPDNLRGAAAHVPVRHAPPDRRRQEGLRRSTTMAEFKEISPQRAAPAQQAAELGRQPLPADQALERPHGASTTRRRTSTSGTSSARSRCWCW